VRRIKICSKRLISTFLVLLTFNQLSVCQTQLRSAPGKVNSNPLLIFSPPENDTLPSVSSNRISFNIKEKGNIYRNTIQKPVYFGDQYPQKKISSRITGDISIDLSITNPTCGRGTGSITAIASGGTAPYTYLLRNTYQPFPPRNQGYFLNLPSDDYLLKVIDANGQSAEAIVALNNELAPIKLGLAYVVPSECSKASGSVTLQASGGTPPYQYSKDLVNWQTSNVFNDLSYGFYYFAARDANGCEAWYSNFEDLNHFGCHEPFGGSWTLYACDHEGDVSMSAYGTEGPYQYSIDGINYDKNGNFNNLTYGINTIYVKDKNEKTYLYSFTIFKLCQVKLTYTSTDATCRQNDGKFTVTASDGIGPYTYTIDGVHYQTNNTFANLAPGIYTVTAKDASGKTNSLDITIYDHCPVLEVIAGNAACLGNNGTIIATGTHGTEPYQFSLDGNNFQTNHIFNNLGTGEYTVTVKDALGFVATATVDITQECLAINTEQKNVVCGNHNGSVTITAAGGRAPYTYSINGVNFQTANVITGLEAGDYVLTVKDSDGITATKDIIITNTPGPTLTVTEIPTSCAQTDGAITMHAAGGTPPYMYSMNSVYYQFSNLFTHLSSDPYRAIVKDANGCTTGIGGWLLFNCTNIETEVKNAFCGTNNGSVKVTARGGIEPYQYSIDGIHFRDENVFNDLTPGKYTITVKASDGILKTSDVTIADACIGITIKPTASTCNKPNGSIEIAASAGAAPYTYSIDGIQFQSENIIHDLLAGTYTVTVKDASGLTSMSSARVDNIPGPQVSTTATPASCTNNDGSITIHTTGGTAPFQYSLDGNIFQNKNVFDHLEGKTYNISVKDANSCITSQPIPVSTTNNLTLDAGPDIHICEGIGIALNPLSNARDFKWSPSSGLNNNTIEKPVASPTFTTQYTVTATLGICSAVDDIVVHVDPAPVAIVSKDSVICFGQSIELNGNGGVSYLWYPSTYLDNPASDHPMVLRPASTTTYHLEVTDSKGCKSIAQASVTITVTPPAKVFAGNDTAVVMNQPFQLNATDINNSGFTNFFWTPSYNINNPNLQNPIAVPDKNTTYTVKAVTQSGCEGSDAIFVKVFLGPEIYVPNAFTPGTDGLNDILKPIPIGIKTFKYFTVYNRWGKRIFHTIDPLKGWDGKVNGILQDTGTFVWMTEGMDDKGGTIRRKGSVTLIR
jgi:gliding motility-associated-like protein